MCYLDVASDIFSVTVKGCRVLVPLFFVLTLYSLFHGFNVHKPLGTISLIEKLVLCKWSTIRKWGLESECLDEFSVALNFAVVDISSLCVKSNRWRYLLVDNRKQAVPVDLTSTPTSLSEMEEGRVAPGYRGSPLSPPRQLVAV